MSSVNIALCHNFDPINVFPSVAKREALHVRHLSVWLVEFIKLMGRRRLHPLHTQCPICGQRVQLHVNRAGRRHVFSHARGLYEGCRLCVHYVAKIKCLGSGSRLIFDPHPNERQRFKLPDLLVEK
jgi:hypothetical protein